MECPKDYNIESIPYTYYGIKAGCVCDDTYEKDLTVGRCCKEGEKDHEYSCGDSTCGPDCVHNNKFII